MAAGHVVAVDLATVWRNPDRTGFVRVLRWGEPLEVLGVTDRHVEIRVWKFVKQVDGSEKPVPASGFIAPTKSSRIKPADVAVPRAENRVLGVDFVDVQQGDGAVIETPNGRVILVDGGDNQLFARYLAGRFRTSPDRPLRPEAIVVTHGDADHFEGLSRIRESETHATAWKRLFLAPRRVFHNGLVKRPDKLPNGKNRREIDMLGPTTTVGSERILTGLVDDPRNVPTAELNSKFKAWNRTLRHWEARGPIETRRIARGSDAFAFLGDEAIQVEVLGPMLTVADGVTGLRFLGEPPKGPRLDVESAHARRRFTGTSASHTINGHSIILRLRYGDVRYLLTGDLNEEASARLLAESAGTAPLQAEVFKVPHHGSADFDPELLKAVAPVVSVVSSGDENTRKEYIHPRATLVGALGKYSRVAEPLVFVTELVAFFQTEDWTAPEIHRLGPDGLAVLQDGAVVLLPKSKQRKAFFAFSRAAFGIVRTRTDGRRLLVVTDSGQADLKEAYAYEVRDGKAAPSRVRQA
jgi:beta-lactamase superfamily II metal-dependent hydrolase